MTLRYRLGPLRTPSRTRECPGGYQTVRTWLPAHLAAVLFRVPVPLLLKPLFFRFMTLFCRPPRPCEIFR